MLCAVFALCLPPVIQAQQPGTLVTIAGGGSGQGDNVPATSVALNVPLGIAVDAQGNLYIADTGNHRIRRVTPAGVISTVAGTGVAGFAGDGGQAAQAQLNRPQGIAVDAQGNVYIGDTGNRRVRRVTPAGVISTVAGTGTRGFTGDFGPATQATFDEIVAVAALGNAALLVSDGVGEGGQGNNRVRQIDLGNGTIATIAGNGSAQAASAQDGGQATRAGMTPEQIAVGPDGVYFADFNNGRIRRLSVVDSIVVIHTVAGRTATFAEVLAGDLYKGDGGRPTLALFNVPTGVAVEQGALYIADTGNHRIRAVFSDTVVTVAGTGIAGASPDGEPGLLSNVAEPSRMLIDSNGDLIFIDTGNNRIRKLVNPRFRTPFFNQITTSVNFDRASIGDPVVRTIEVENRGNVSMRVLAAQTTHPAFRVVSTLPLEIGIAQRAQLQVAFDPQAEGIVEALVTLTTSDPRTPSATVAVSGFGEAPNIGLFPADALVFDRTFIGQTSAQTVRIANTGAGTLVIARADIPDTQFAALLPASLRIDAGQSQLLTVEFRPAREGLQESALTLHSNALNAPQITLRVQGIGQPAQPGGFVDIAPDVGLGDAGAGFGAAWGDFDNDGDPDLYLTRSLQPNRLYRNDGGQFADIAPQLGVNDAGDSSAGIWGDFDNDGDLDLFVTNFGQPNRLFRNDGGAFVDVAPQLGLDDAGDGYGAAWADVNRNGFLDLYVANFGPNRFYLNRGGTFVECADSLGIADAESSIQPAWADVTNNGYPDLFLANSGPNRLFFNNGGTFTDQSHRFNPVDTGPSFGAAWGDFDNDGDLDLFIPYFGETNRFYINNNTQFLDIAQNAGITHAGRARGAAWGDFDNDGFLDLFVARSGQPNLFYRSREQSGLRVFSEQAEALGLALDADSRGVALVDIDGDGRLDMYVVVQNGPDRLYKNREANGNWVAVRPIGTESRLDVIGLRVEIEYDGKRAFREIASGTSFLSQHAPLAAFGLGEAEQIDVLTLRWPSGIVQQLRHGIDDLSVNRTLAIAEQRPSPPVAIRVEALASTLLANGIAETQVIAEVLNADGRRALVSDRTVRFRIENGSGLLLGTDTATVRDGAAQIRYRAGQIAGQVVIAAESAGLTTGRVSIVLQQPFGDDALIVRTIAGAGFDGGFSGDGGPATEAALQLPQAVLADTAGHIYIADAGNQRIRVVDIATGFIQTRAGTGAVGLGRLDDGLPAGEGRINSPSGLAFDAAGNLLFSEAGSHIVRRVLRDTLRTIAGTGTAQFGGDGGPAGSANLRRPLGIAADKNGNVYIADEFNHRIRKIDASGIISAFAGSASPDVGGFAGDGGPATSARIHSPAAVAVDSLGRVYIADTGNHRVRRVDVNGVITTLAGTGAPGFSGDGGPGHLAQINAPSGLAIDGRGHLYIADTENHRVRLLDTNTGLIQTVAGTGQAQFDLESGGARAVSFNAPAGLAIGPTGTVLIADRNNHRVRELTVNFDLPSLFAPPEKSVDFNGDGRIDFVDFLLFVSAFGTFDTRFDLTGNGQVGFADFLLFARAYEQGRLTVQP